MIVGIGIDLAPISRIASVLARYGERFERRLFSEEECRYCNSRPEPAQHFAARFAAKEAALKALGGPEGLAWKDLEVSTGSSGAPALRLWGGASVRAVRLGVKWAHLSLSHAGDFAAAVVVLEN